MACGTRRSIRPSEPYFDGDTPQWNVPSYDILGREVALTAVDASASRTTVYDGFETAVTDAGNLGLGKVHEESMTGYSKVYSYSPFDDGRLTGTTITIGTESYTTVYSYDAQGRPLTEQYPDNTTTPGGFVVQYTYSPVGHLEAVESLQNNTVLYQLVETDAQGRILEEWLGDGSTVTQAFQGASSRIASQQSMIGAATVQEFTYAYDATGNMLSRMDDLHGLTETFSYDTLDRLTGASLGGGAPVNYGFSPMGNLIEKSDVGTSHLYNLAQPHAVSAVVGGGLPSHTFAYDANGNLDTLDSTPMISWSSYDKPVAITTASVSYGFEYGPDRARYRKVHNGQTTHYVGKNFEAINASGVGFDTHRHYVRANGRVVMIREDVNGAVTHRYVHTDHLGSITALTDEATGAVVARYSYDAWGLRRNPTTWQPGPVTSFERRGYTGHEHLDDVGIIHMNGRLYSPSLGRMLSPDPVTQAPENAQNYNRYSYAFNNPLKYTDPTGWFACFAFGAAVNDGGGCGGYPSLDIGSPLGQFGPSPLSGLGWFMNLGVLEFVGLFAGSNVPLSDLASPYFKWRYGEEGLAILGDIANHNGTPTKTLTAVGARQAGRVGVRSVLDWEPAGNNYPIIDPPNGNIATHRVLGANIMGFVAGLLYDRLLRADNEWALTRRRYILLQDQVYLEYYYTDEGGLNQFKGWVDTGDVYMGEEIGDGEVLQRQKTTDSQGDLSGGAIITDEWD